MQNDNVQGILFNSNDLLDLTKKSRRQKVLIRINTSKKNLHKILTKRSSAQAKIKGPTYVRNRQAVVSSSDDRELAISDLIARFHIN